MTPPPSLRTVQTSLRTVQTGEFWCVLGAETPDGPRVIAQGTREMCELIVAGRPIFGRAGDLLLETGSVPA